MVKNDFRPVLNHGLSSNRKRLRCRNCDKRQIGVPGYKPWAVKDIYWISNGYNIHVIQSIQTVYTSCL